MLLLIRGYAFNDAVLNADTGMGVSRRQRSISSRWTSAFTASAGYT